MSPQAPKSRLQFSIRLAFFGLTLIAIALGIVQFLLPPPVRLITAKQAQQIKHGMSQREVMRVLGSPHRRETHGSTTQWAFDFLVTDELPDAHMEIIFDAEGKAVEVSCSGYSAFANAIDPAKPMTP
jgi:hypothetical protein